MIGLDNSGKSTLLNHFKPEEQQNQNIGNRQIQLNNNRTVRPIKL